MLVNIPAYRLKCHALCILAAIICSAQSTYVIAAPFNEINTSAFNNRNGSITIGPSLLSFRYQEFNQDDQLINKETGILAGVSGGIGYTRSKWQAQLAGSYHTGTVDYDGQSQAGTPLKSRSDANILDGYAILRRQLKVNTRPLALYGGFGYHYWRRNIRPTTIGTGQTINGLLEFYDWTYWLFGINTQVLQSNADELTFDLRFMRMQDSNLEVDFMGLNDFDNAHLNLGEAWGSRVSLSWQKRTGSGSFLIVEPYIELIDINRSAPVHATINDNPTTSTITEPRSETHNVGLKLQWLGRF
jgi:hypothetical protein